MLENLRKYLSSTDDLSGSIRKVSQNFVKFAGELLKVREKNSKKDAEYLKQRILEADETESADWLISKLDEMKK
jgi:hypothetical protein